MLATSFATRSFRVVVALSVFSAISMLAQRPASPVGIPDGGTREVLESIFIPPKPNAPFSLTLDTEWTRPFGNGGTYTVANERHIARDTAGRVYEERWYLVPKGGKVESTMNYIQIADPTQHTLYNCRVETRKCFLLGYTGSTSTIYSPATRPSGPLPNGTGFHTHEELGSNTLFGFETEGYRESTTLNPGTFGNDQPMVTTREFWYSTQLGIDLISKLDSPKSGRQTFTVTVISAAEPDPKLFALPEGYELVDRRQTEPPAN
jgi:hypothetical protein